MKFQTFCWAAGTFEFRGVGPKPPQHLDMQETIAPIEENGFLLVDFTPENITLRYFKWNQKTQPVSDIELCIVYGAANASSGAHAGDYCDGSGASL